MILPDINVLIYAHNADDDRFAAADRWFNEILNGPDQLCLCWETINGFIRLSTSARVFRRPLTLQQAFSAVRYWLDIPNSVVLDKTPRHFEVLERTARAANARGPKFSDAVLAAIAIEHNATLATTDADFRRFKVLKFINPLVESNK
jgi:toxin-antitoxin system PIN domain toxin